MDETAHTARILVNQPIPAGRRLTTLDTPDIACVADRGNRMRGAAICVRILAAVLTDPKDIPDTVVGIGLDSLLLYHNPEGFRRLSSARPQLWDISPALFSLVALNRDLPGN